MEEGRGVTPLAAASTVDRAEARRAGDSGEAEEEVEVEVRVGVEVRESDDGTAGEEAGDAEDIGGSREGGVGDANSSH